VKHGVQVAHLVNGETVSVRVLSGRAERRAAWLVGVSVLALTVGAGLALALGLVTGHRLVHGPGFVALWTGLGAALALVAAARARARAGRYLIGADIDDDAFAGVPGALVARAGASYELRLSTGMSGTLDEGRTSALAGGASAVDALVRAGRLRFVVGESTHAELVVGKTTFVVRGAPLGAGRPDVPASFWRPLVRRTFAPIALASIATFVLLTVPAGAALSERDMRSAIPEDASPWEVEKLLRFEAQLQSSTLHACFDPLPMSCQHPGYVGVGLSLAKDGEIRTSWIARSTYGKDCPVDACMSNVISGWFFEPLPEAMKIVLPVQVLRTNKPLPTGTHAQLGPGPRRASGLY
jgi:hypothetical protein